MDIVSKVVGDHGTLWNHGCKHQNPKNKKHMTYYHIYVVAGDDDLYTDTYDLDTNVYDCYFNCQLKMAVIGSIRCIKMFHVFS